MNQNLQDLINICDKIGATVMSFNVCHSEMEVPYATIEDKDGRLTTVYCDGNIWG